ncbi:hypothetical protein ACLOAV_002955 [Pseudogymnoascus australis]
MRSSFFYLVAGAIGFACARPEFDNLDGVAGCKDGAALVSCMQPLIEQLTIDQQDGNSCTTVSCACDILKTEIDCYTDFCPEAPIPTEATDEYNDKCANDKGSAGMLSAPSVGLVAGVVGVMAML